MNLDKALGQLQFVGDRRPTSSPEELGGAFARLTDYRDGAVFLAHYAGDSAWERHPEEEIVFVVEGETNIVLLIDDTEEFHLLVSNELMVVPKGRWHRFETPKGVKLLSVTPEPTQHSLSRPDACC